MKKPGKKKAMELIQKALYGIYEFKTLAEDFYDFDDSVEFRTWHRNTKVAIEKIFDDGSKHVNEFLECFSLADDDIDAIKGAESILISMFNEINEHWDDNLPIQRPSPAKRTIQTDTKKVFVIHGRDEGTREMVAGFLRQLELEPVILSEQSSQGRTIIEKFEQHANVGFAVALLTPDDDGSLKGVGNKPNPRARQNVIFELGFFIGKLRRERVCALTKGEVEIPSDYSGVVYISLDSAGGWKLQLCRELRAAGYDVDANRIVQ